MEEKQQMSYHSSSKVFDTGSCAFPGKKLEKHGLDENATGKWKAEQFPLSKGSLQGRKLLNVCMNDPEKQTEGMLIKYEGSPRHKGCHYQHEIRRNLGRF